MEIGLMNFEHYILDFIEYTGEEQDKQLFFKTFMRYTFCLKIELIEILKNKIIKVNDFVVFTPLYVCRLYSNDNNDILDRFTIYDRDNFQELKRKYCYCLK